MGGGLPLVARGGPRRIGWQGSQVTEIVPARPMPKVLDVGTRLQELILGLVENEQSQGVVRVSLLSGIAHMMWRVTVQIRSVCRFHRKPCSWAGLRPLSLMPVKP